MSNLYHHVYLWLSEDVASEGAQAVADSARKYLTSIPGVQNLVVAAPAGVDLPMVEGGYSVALLMEFTDAATLESYEAHPDHVRFVEENKHLFSRIQVYNSTSIAA